ncbi:hypothetical protein NGM37_32990, partial [Streptomyces sp. TRM76130]|nr:hypothetical protein [Streptomyces sp. TRM76130]
RAKRHPRGSCGPEAVSLSVVSSCVVSGISWAMMAQFTPRRDQPTHRPPGSPQYMIFGFEL